MVSNPTLTSDNWSRNHHACRPFLCSSNTMPRARRRDEHIVNVSRFSIVSKCPVIALSIEVSNLQHTQIFIELIPRNCTRVLAPQCPSALLHTCQPIRVATTVVTGVDCYCTCYVKIHFLISDLDTRKKLNIWARVEFQGALVYRPHI